MIKDYLQQLKDLQQDRSTFQTSHQKHTLKRSLSRQEDKYQAYIIDQMNIQNRIIASNHLGLALQHPVRAHQAHFFKHLTLVTTTPLSPPPEP